MVPEICQPIPITAVPNLLIKIAATLPKSPISEPPICILALTNYKNVLDYFQSWAQCTVPEIPNSYLLKRNEKQSIYFGDRQDQLTIPGKHAWMLDTDSTYKPTISPRQSDKHIHQEHKHTC